MISPTEALRRARDTIREWAVKGHAAWDADRDSKAGKILMALAGHIPGYAPDLDAAFATLDAALAAPPGNADDTDLIATVKTKLVAGRAYSGKLSDPDFVALLAPRIGRFLELAELRNLAAQVERLRDERDNHLPKVDDHSGVCAMCRHIDGHDPTGCIVEDYATIAAERDALRAMLERCREYGFNGSRVYDAMKAVTADEIDTLLAEAAHG